MHIATIDVTFPALAQLKFFPSSNCSPFTFNNALELQTTPTILAVNIIAPIAKKRSSKSIFVSTDDITKIMQAMAIANAK